jgi:DNA-binding NarL/FixJ family response regulator
VEGYRLHVKHPAVLQAALEKVGVNKSVGELANAVSTKVVKDTSRIEVTLEERDPALAAKLANALAGEYIRYLQIAQALGLSEPLVKSEVKAILRKTGTCNRAEAVAAVLKRGVIS